MIALAAPTRLWVAGETSDSLAPARAQYRAAGAEPALKIGTSDEGTRRTAACEWLLSQVQP